MTSEVDLDVDSDLSLLEAHTIAHDAEHELMHALPRLARATIHAHPVGSAGDATHDRIAHHRR